MPDREKVIKGLECCSTNRLRREDCEAINCAYLDLEGNGCIHQLIRDALALLNAQEPVKPVVDVDTWTCGNCGHTLEHQQLLDDNVLFHEQYNYCPECGRAVKWE
jgi:ribosomal protein S27AE